MSRRAPPFRALAALALAAFTSTGTGLPVAIPLAAGVLAGAGILLSPALGAVLMSASTVIVAFNARLLGRGTDSGASSVY